MRSAVGDVNGVGSLEKEYLLEDESTAVLMRDVFLNGDDLIYHISCRAEQSSYPKGRPPLLQQLHRLLQGLTSKRSSAETGSRPQSPSGRPRPWQISTATASRIVVGSNEGKLYVFNRDGSTVPGFPTAARSRSAPPPPSPTWTATVSSMLSSDPTTTCSTPGTGPGRTPSRLSEAHLQRRRIVPSHRRPRRRWQPGDRGGV